MSADAGDGELARALTQKTERLCSGLADGEADILELVTPITAELLCWWFGSSACDSRDLNFHTGQRQAILNTVVAHEVLGSTTLRSLYEIVVPEALSIGRQLIEVTAPHYLHPSYCVESAVAADGIRVLQALLIWQLLNKKAALQQSRDDPRFTRSFLLAALDPASAEYWRDTWLGKLRSGIRDFSTSDIATCAALLVPARHREYVNEFCRNRSCDESGFSEILSADGMLAIIAQQHFVDIASDRCGVHAREFFAALPELMVFSGAADSVREPLYAAASHAASWQKNLTRFAENKGRRFIRMDFSVAAYNRWTRDGEGGPHCFPHVIAGLDAAKQNQEHRDDD